MDHKVSLGISLVDTFSKSAKNIVKGSTAMERGLVRYQKVLNGLTGQQKSIKQFTAAQAA